ncbi:hypothetical protein CR513_10932, partial [Mucuna pruriens]
MEQKEVRKMKEKNSQPREEKEKRKKRCLFLQDVFPKDVPCGLQPLRGIGHHTHLTLRETLPKRATYRTKLEESNTPHSLFDDLFDELHGSQIFSKINLRSRYHQIRMKKSDEWKMALKGMSGFSSVTNASSTFMRLMNHALRSLIDKCVVVYFGDILIYMTCLNDNLLHVRSVLEILTKETTYANLKKCTYFTHDVAFLGYVVGSQESMLIRKWLKPF